MREEIIYSVMNKYVAALEEHLGKSTKVGRMLLNGLEQILQQEIPDFRYQQELPDNNQREGSMIEALERRADATPKAYTPTGSDRSYTRDNILKMTVHGFLGIHRNDKKGSRFLSRYCNSVADSVTRERILRETEREESYREYWRKSGDIEKEIRKMTMDELLQVPFHRALGCFGVGEKTREDFGRYMFECYGIRLAVKLSK